MSPAPIRTIAALAAAVSALLAMAPAASALEGTYTETTLESTLVPSPVPISVYTPPGYDPDRAEPYPLIIQLHGGGGDNTHMERMSRLLEQAIAEGRVPPAVSVMPAAGRTFYMDFKDGSQKWESFVTEDLIAHMRKTYNVVEGREGTLITGISMGGMGSLRMAFKHPDIFHAVASMEPGIEPNLDFDEIAVRDRFWRSDELFRQIYGDPVDEAYWQANNPANIAAADPERLVDLAIYLEAGDQDMFYLHHGTEFVHRILFDAGLSHEYRLVRGAEHVGPSIGPRFLDAMSFFGRVLDPPVWVDDQVLRTRQYLDGLKERAGMEVIEHDPRRLRAN
ncbi:MAG: esterase [Alphaproteobacteria bacterium]|nr:esterase [Alphaproteobacteria bacterium]